MPPFSPPPAFHRICSQCRSTSPLGSLIFPATHPRRPIVTKVTSPPRPGRLGPGGSLSNHPLTTRPTKWPPDFFSSATPLSHNRGAAVTTTRATSTTRSNSSSTTSLPVSDQAYSDFLPHRRRQASRKRNALASEFAQAAGSPTAPAPEAADGAEALPPDASAILGTAAASAPAQSLRRVASALLSLSKPRLTVLVVLTAMAPYALYPSPDLLSPAMTETPSLSPLTLLFLTTGTALCSASANALNMLYEPKTDGMMTRTRNRPLVRALLSRRAAVLFAAACAAVGIGSLYVGVNPTVSFLGAANIVIYAGIYTPLKRISAFNTWVGAVVGGIPPLMGWAAAAGETASADGSWRELLFNFPSLWPDMDAAAGSTTMSSVGGWLLAGLLFAWQFPHFMALSWPIRDEYRNAGLRMLSWVNPARNGRVALRYSLAFFPICIGLCAVGVTEWTFAATSLPVNGWLVWEAVRFWKRCGYGGTARGLFWASVWHLPAVMVLALVQKKDMWQRVWRGVVREDPGGEDKGEWVYYDDDDEDEDAGEEEGGSSASKKP